MQTTPVAATAASLMERLTGAEPSTSSMHAFVPLDGSPATLSYYEETPCAPVPAALHHRVRLRRPLHRRLAHRVRRAHIVAKPVGVPHAAPTRVHHRAHPHPHPQAPRPVASVAPTRCEILHREALYRPALPLDQDTLTLVTEDVPTDITAFTPSLIAEGPPAEVRGLALVIPSPPLFGGIFKPFHPYTSAAPEPETWALLLVGVAAIGAALRRRRPRPLAAD